MVRVVAPTTCSRPRNCSILPGPDEGRKAGHRSRCPPTLGTARRRRSSRPVSNPGRNGQREYWARLASKLRMRERSGTVPELVDPGSTAESAVAKMDAGGAGRLFVVQRGQVAVQRGATITHESRQSYHEGLGDLCFECVGCERPSYVEELEKMLEVTADEDDGPRAGRKSLGDRARCRKLAGRSEDPLTDGQ